MKLKLNSDSLKNYVPGQQLRVFVGIENITALSDLVRTYSVWNYNKEKEEIDLAVCTFSNGQGTKWVCEIEPGEIIYFGGPKGKFTFDSNAQTYLFLGDISALAHFYELNRQTTVNQKVFGFIFNESLQNFYTDLNSDTKFNFIVTEEEHSKIAIAEIGKLNLHNTGTLVYIAGETTFCTELNTHFRRTLNWNTKQIKTKPFWHPHKKGLE